jgi:hypothetical protein
MEPIYPLISTSVKGPLGIVHLPRLWLKILLHACGRLPEGYRHGSGGFDQMTCEDLGIDEAAFVAHIESAKPGYLQLEAWVREHATKIDPASIEAHNEKFLNWRIREDLASERRARFHIADPNFGHGITLNDLDDWDLAHAQLVASKVGTA